MSTDDSNVNGIDVERLHDTLREVQATPRLARLKLRAHNRWIEGAHGCTVIEDFTVADEEEATHNDRFEIDADEPDMLLGTDAGPNATEVLLHALASCLQTSFIYQAAARGVQIDALELELEGDLDLRGFLGVDPSVRNGFTQIRVTFHVTSDAPREQIESLCRAAQQRSPVFDMVTHPTPVKVDLEIE